VGLCRSEFWPGSAAQVHRSERLKINKWSGRKDLNLRPPGPEPDSKTY
jgi:hypothetical protein